MTLNHSKTKSGDFFPLNRDDATAGRVCSAYRAADSTMRDFSFYNTAIGFCAVGFCADDNACTGIAVTPWGMMLLRVLPPAQRTLPDGETVTRHYPSGDYDFITGHLDGVGAVETCPLFSSMLSFSNHLDACEAAEKALIALFEPPAHPPLAKNNLLTRRALLGRAIP